MVRWPRAPARLATTTAGALAGLLFTVIGLSLLFFPTLTKASADSRSTPYACLNPRAPDATGGPWLTANSTNRSWQSPTDPLQDQTSTAESAVASSLGSALGSDFTQSSVKDYANAQCDTFWDITYEDANASTVELLVFETNEVLGYNYVINTWDMNNQTLADGTQLLTQDSDGYLAYAVTASPDGLVTVILSQGANSEWLISGWPTTTYSPTTGPTPFPEPISVDQASTLVQTMDHDILNSVSALPSSSTTTSTTNGTSTSTSPSSTTMSSSSGGNGAVTSSSGSLAFAGAGTGLRVAATLGALLVIVGLLMLALADAPRRVLRRLFFASDHNQPAPPTSSDCWAVPQPVTPPKHLGIQLHRRLRRG